MYDFDGGGRRTSEFGHDLARDIMTLDRLGVPYAIFEHSGDRVRRSRSAVDLLATRLDEWESIGATVRGGALTDAARVHHGTSIPNVVYSINRLGGQLALIVFHPIECTGRRDGRRWIDLTPREREVADHIVCGRTSRQVAACLGISVHTARRHTERLYAKLGVRRRVELAHLAHAASPSHRAPTVDTAHRAPSIIPTDRTND